MSLCGLCDVAARVSGAVGRAATSYDRLRTAETKANAVQSEGEAQTAEDEANDRMRSAQERARKLIQDLPLREAEHKRRQEAAAAAVAKQKINMFLMAHAYAGVDKKRTRMFKTKYPLHTAVKRYDAEMIVLLLQAGANPYVTDSYGQTPLELAKKTLDDRVINAFQICR